MDVSAIPLLDGTEGFDVAMHNGVSVRFAKLLENNPQLSGSDALVGVMYTTQGKFDYYAPSISAWVASQAGTQRLAILFVHLCGEPESCARDAFDSKILRSSGLGSVQAKTLFMPFQNFYSKNLFVFPTTGAVARWNEEQLDSLVTDLQQVQLPKKEDRVPGRPPPRVPPPVWTPPAPSGLAADDWLWSSVRLLKQEAAAKVEHYLRELDQPAGPDKVYIEISAPPGIGKSAIIREMYALHGLTSRDTVSVVLDDIVSDQPGYTEQISALRNEWLNRNIDDAEMIKRSSAIYEFYQPQAERIEQLLLREARERGFNVIYERNLWIRSDKAFLDHATPYGAAGYTTDHVQAVASPRRLRERIISQARKTGRMPDYRRLPDMIEFAQRQMLDSYDRFNKVHVYDLDFQKEDTAKPSKLMVFRGEPHKDQTYGPDAVCPAARIAELSAAHALLPLLTGFLKHACGMLTAAGFGACATCGTLAVHHCACNEQIRYCDHLCQTRDFDTHKKTCTACAADSQ